MVQQNPHRTLINRVVLLIGDTRLPGASIWHNTFAGCTKVAISDSSAVDTDAILTSVFACERFGCRSGSSDDTLGVMNIYDTWMFEQSIKKRPRFFVSNAVWRQDPPIDIAITKRIDILWRTINDFNLKNHNTANSIAIECASLGFWNRYSQEEQSKAVEIARKKIEDTFDC